MDQQQSAWLDFLGWIDQPGAAVRSLIHGKPGGAVRHLADFALDPLDALIPGDVIPQMSRPTDDQPAGSIEKILTNPITYVGLIPGAGPAVQRAARAAAAKTYQALPDVGKRLADDTRRTVGWDDYSQAFTRPEVTAARTPPPGWDGSTPFTTTYGAKTIQPEDLLAQASGIEQLGRGAQLADAEQFIRAAGLPTTSEKQILSDALHNLDYTAGGPVPTVLVPGWVAQGKPLVERVNEAKRRVGLLLGKGMQGDAAKLNRLIEGHYGHTERQLQDALVNRGISPGREQGDYLLRRYTGQGGPSSSTKLREFNTAEQLVEHLQNNPRVRLDRDYVAAITERAAKQGTMLKRAFLRDELTDPSVSRHLLDEAATGPEAEAARALMKQSMQAAVPDSDTWARLRYELHGTEPQGMMADLARSVNTVFKPAAVYGVVPFIKLGSIVRNQLTALWQLGGTPEGRSYLARNPGDVVRNLFGAFDDGAVKGLGFKRISGGEITQSLDAIDQAAKASGGSLAGTSAALRNQGHDTVADALEFGVMQGYVSSERLLNDALTARTSINPINWILPGRSAVSNINGAMFGGLEQRMRLAAFLDTQRQLVAKGMGQREASAKAAKWASDTFLDYNVSSQGNRTLRTVFPFAQFVVKSARQQAEVLTRMPGVLPAVGTLYGGDELPDYARQQAHIGTVLPGMAPTDVFNTLPNLTGSSSFGGFVNSAKSAANALHPLLGASIGLASGVDTFTGKPYLQDARLPGRDPYTTERNAGDVGYGLLEDIGLAQPIAGAVQQAKTLGRMPSAGTAALRYATGINVLTPDPQRVEAQSLRADLQADPRVRTFESLYSKSPDQSLQAALKRLNEVQKELKQKAAQAAGSPGIPPG